jgi:hypothetical protein
MILGMIRNGRLDSRSFAQSDLYEQITQAEPASGRPVILATQSWRARRLQASSIRIRGRRSPNPQAGTFRARPACEPRDREFKALGLLIELKQDSPPPHPCAGSGTVCNFGGARCLGSSRPACQRRLALGQERRSAETYKVSRFPAALQIKAVRATPPAMFRPTGPAQA